MKIKRYVNHLSLPDGKVYILDPLYSFDAKTFSEKVFSLECVPGEYACYIFQDENDLPKEFVLVHDNIFNFVKDEREIVYSEYVGTVESTKIKNYLGFFRDDKMLSEDKIKNLTDFLDKYKDNDYHINKPCFNTYLFKEKLHNDFEGAFVKVFPKDYPVYVMRNKYRKIIAIKILFL